MINKEMSSEEVDFEKMGKISKSFLLAMGLLLINSLKPEDFIDLELKEVRISLPKKLVEDKYLLDIMLLSTSSIYESLIKNYLYSLKLSL